MKSPIVGLRVASVVFGLMAIGQCLRLLFQVEITAGGCQIPVWCSGLAVVFLGALSVWLWTLSRARPAVTAP